MVVNISLQANEYRKPSKIGFAACSLNSVFKEMVGEYLIVLTLDELLNP